MSAVKPVDLSNVLLILGSFVGVNNILRLSENSRYSFEPPAGDADAAASWKGGQSEEYLVPPLLYLGIGEHLYDPLGWVIGSDSDSEKCDLQIAEHNQTGISRRFIRIDISPVTHNPRVTVLSNRTILIHDGDNELTCKPGEPREIYHAVTIDLGAVTFRAWPPKRTDAEVGEYTKKARLFNKDVLLAIPKYLPSIGSQPETAMHNTRYGRNDAVYVNEVGFGSKGAHASVMRVKDRKTGNIFGAKEPYYKASDNNDIARNRFEALKREYDHIIKFDHPHIVKAYDLVLAEDVKLPPWMIVEYIPLNLDDVDVLTDLNEQDGLTVLTHLSSALHYIHTCGMTHRDVTPSNALIHRQDHGFIVKLADFGTSKHNGSEKMDTFIGTEVFMAPELFESHRCYTNKVDMWSLGLIGVRLLTAWDPELDSERGPGDFTPWMRDVILPHIDQAPERLHPLLKGLLRKNPKKRWSAQRCLIWLEAFNTNRGDEGVINTRKRSASKLENSFDADGHDGRRRGPDPSLPATSERAVHNAGGKSDGNSTMPDTLSPRDYEPISAAPTPHPDDALFDDVDGGSEESGDGSDAELEDDWNEDDSQAGEEE